MEAVELEKILTQDIFSESENGHENEHEKSFRKNNDADDIDAILNFSFHCNDSESIHDNSSSEEDVDEIDHEDDDDDATINGEENRDPSDPEKKKKSRKSGKNGKREKREKMLTKQELSDALRLAMSLECYGYYLAGAAAADRLVNGPAAHSAGIGKQIRLMALRLRADPYFLIKVRDNSRSRIDGGIVRSALSWYREELMVLAAVSNGGDEVDGHAVTPVDPAEDVLADRLVGEAIEYGLLLTRF